MINKILLLSIIAALVVACSKTDEEFHLDVLNKASAYEDAGQYDLAIIEWEKMTERLPCVELGWLGLAECYYTIGDYDKSRDSIREVLNIWKEERNRYWWVEANLGEQDKDDNADRLAESYQIHKKIQISFQYAKLGENEKALRTLEKINIDHDKNEWLRGRIQAISQEYEKLRSPHDGELNSR